MRRSELTLGRPAALDVERSAADNDLTMISAEQFAGLLQVSKRTLWRLLSAQILLPPIRIGGSVRWRLADVRRWIDAGCQPTDSRRK